SKQVRQAEGHEESVGGRPCAQNRRDQEIAHEAEHAADEGKATYRGEGPEERHGPYLLEFARGGKPRLDFGPVAAAPGSRFSRSATPTAAVGGLRLLVGIGDRVEQDLADLFELALVLHLQAEHVLDVEHVDRALAE